MGRGSTTGRWSCGLAGLLACGLLLLAGTSAPAAAQVPFGQGRLWQVERDGAAPSYVFGTFHGTDRRLLELPAAVEETLFDARRLILELRLDRAAALRVGAATQAPPGRHLDRLVGPALFAEVTAVGQRYGLSARALARLRPWALIMMFSMPPQELARQSAGILPLDQQLQVSAQQRGIPVYGLESVAEQVAIFDGLSDAQQVALLRAALEENDRIDRWYESFLGAYLKGDGASLLELMQAQIGADQTMISQVVLERLLTERNLRMVERLQEHLAAGGSFVAVGDLHLRGADGILSGLERRGYRIVRLL
jgi:uncharacterized protein YbaP (TraB family)